MYTSAYPYSLLLFSLFEGEMIVGEMYEIVQRSRAHGVDDVQRQLQYEHNQEERRHGGDRLRCRQNDDMRLWTVRVCSAHRRLL
jgi:hypothetical protein